MKAVLKPCNPCVQVAMVTWLLHAVHPLLGWRVGSSSAGLQEALSTAQAQVRQGIPKGGQLARRYYQYYYKYL